MAADAEKAEKAAQLMLKDLRKEGKAAIAILQGELKRTGRDDINGILHWVEKSFGD